MPAKIKQVRFAYKNMVYPAPPSMPPPLSYSVSTAASSVGPITPPVMAHSLPYPVQYAPSKSQRPRSGSVPMYMPPPKTPSSSSSRYSGPARPHRYFESDAVVWDLMDHPSTISRHRQHLSSRALIEPATEPPMRYISIVSTYLPWSVKVQATNGQYVSLQDVIDAIYRTLRINITQPEFGLFKSEHDRRRAVRAYEERYRRLRSQRAYEEEKRSGMKRIDFLMGRTRFVGLSNDGRRPDEWHLRVS